MCLFVGVISSYIASNGFCGRVNKIYVTLDMIIKLSVD